MAAAPPHEPPSRAADARPRATVETVETVEAVEPPRGARGAALIRDVILGGQDGLVNVLGLVLGMAVATGSSRVVVTAGLAALLAESIAMAGVAFTASGAERQLGSTIRRTLDERREAVTRSRDADRRRRLADAGLSPESIALVVAETEAEATAWRDQVELMRTALAPARETRPVRAAAVVGVSTALGSAVPLLPFVRSRSPQRPRSRSQPARSCWPWRASSAPARPVDGSSGQPSRWWPSDSSRRSPAT